MKIGIDFHGVINKLPLFFAEMTKLFIDAGHEIHIITGKEITNKYLEEIKKFNIKYTHIFSIITHCKKMGYLVSYSDEDNPYIDIKIWNRMKSAYCLMNNIDLMIDDSNVYGNSFLTPYMQIKIKKEI